MKKGATLPFVHLLHLPSIITAFLALSLLISNVNALEITSLDDFIDFTNNVNDGTTFSGDTVYLTTDLDMTSHSPSFVPVGNTSVSTKTFRGTFDGQGHVISNLVISSDEFRYMGIFGFSYGATIKNLIVDSSCSFASNYSNADNNCATGGIIGQCDSTNGECIVDNCVNMAQITYSGTNTTCTYVGGIIGKFTPSTYNTSITNCVNYGNVSSVSSSLRKVRVGGITGEMWTYNLIAVSNTISNCVNFGSLYQSGEIKYSIYIGGICGVDKPNVAYENCVDFGGISYNTSITSTVSVGSISGYSINGTLGNCFWDEGLGLNATGKSSEDAKSEGNVESFNTLSLTELELLNILNNGGDNMWAVINFDSRGGSAVGPMLVLLTSTNKAGISFPTSEKVESVFDGWYNDEGLETVFDTSTLKPGNTTVYAKWIVNHYTITFTVDGVIYNESSQPYGSTIEYPPINPTKEGFTFDGWNKTFTTVPAHNIAIESLWTINSYTITFTVDGVAYNESSQPYGSNIEYPPSNPTKEGHTFNEWNKTFTTVPARNIIIESLWTINHYTITFTVDGNKYNGSSQPYGSTIEYSLINPIKEGFTFDGWYTNNIFTNKAENNLIITENITLYGRFISTTIKIEFNTKDLSKDELIKEIKKITDCTDCFTINEYKSDGDTTTIIIKFNDVNDAKNFVDTVQR